jgi:hypothetical protein
MLSAGEDIQSISVNRTRTESHLLPVGVGCGSLLWLRNERAYARPSRQQAFPNELGDGAPNGDRSNSQLVPNRTAARQRLSKAPLVDMTPQRLDSALDTAIVIHEVE